MSTLDKIKQTILDLGAVEKYIHPYDQTWEFRCIINTIYGELVVTLHKRDFTALGEPRKKNRLASIFSYFKDYDKAAEFLKKEKGISNCNQKWNIHAVGDGGINQLWEDCLLNFVDKVGRIVVK